MILSSSFTNKYKDYKLWGRKKKKKKEALLFLQFFYLELLYIILTSAFFDKIHSVKSAKGKKMLKLLVNDVQKFNRS